MESNHKKRNKTREGNGTIHRIIKIERGTTPHILKKKFFIYKESFGRKGREGGGAKEVITLL